MKAQCTILLFALLPIACGSEPGERVEGPDLAAFHAGRMQFPGAQWAPIDDASRIGWDPAALDEARAYWKTLDSAAVFVVHRGVAVASWGDVAARYTCQSVRKSLLNALIGTEVASGRLQLEATLAELGIDDTPPLRPEEKSARVRDLLLSRSGVYHSALYEFGSAKRHKPPRGSRAPGTLWYYNNWDFNALGTIFERSSGSSIHEAFRQRIAEPLQMEEFRERDVAYLTRRTLTERMQGNESDHAAYVFRMSSRDLARFGLLYLARGRWGERQLLPSDWVSESVAGEPLEEFAERFYGRGTRYGYLWWHYPPDHEHWGRLGTSLWVARGARGHRVFLLPDYELVIVHQVATGGVGLLSQLKRRFFGAHEVRPPELGQLVGKILAAHPGIE